MKKSFILHTDSLHILTKLSNEHKGILFDAIYRYHLGENVELEPLLDIAFTPFKCQFDRDLIKYKSVVDRNKVNGKKGGRPKGADNEHNGYKHTETQNNPVGFSITQKTQANPKNLDSDNDNVNDSDSDNDSVNDNGSLVKVNNVASAPPNIPTKKRIKTLSKDNEQTFEERRLAFKHDVLQFRELYTIEMLAAFFNHWSEKVQNRWLMRMELEKTFEVDRRLIKWKANEKKWSKEEQVHSMRKSFN